MKEQSKQVDLISMQQTHQTRTDGQKNNCQWRNEKAQKSNITECNCSTRTSKTKCWHTATTASPANPSEMWQLCSNKPMRGHNKTDSAVDQWGGTPKLMPCLHSPTKHKEAHSKRAAETRSQLMQTKLWIYWRWKNPSGRAQTTTKGQLKTPEQDAGQPEPGTCTSPSCRIVKCYPVQTRRGNQSEDSGQAGRQAIRTARYGTEHGAGASGNTADEEEGDERSHSTQKVQVQTCDQWDLHRTARQSTGTDMQGEPTVQPRQSTTTTQSLPLWANRPFCFILLLTLEKGDFFGKTGTQSVSTEPQVSRQCEGRFERGRKIDGLSVQLPNRDRLVRLGAGCSLDQRQCQANNLLWRNKGKIEEKKLCKCWFGKANISHSKAGLAAGSHLSKVSHFTQGISSGWQAGNKS